MGKLLSLRIDGNRVVCILVAHVSENLWLVHSGSFQDDGSLDEADPFNEKDLKIKDVIAEAWDQQKERKRLRTSPDTAVLRTLVQAGEDRWLRLVAIGHYRAEEQRASQVAFDENRARNRFERNPFKWGAAAEKLSHADVTFLWSWEEALTSRSKSFVTMRLDNVFQRGHVLPPPGMCKKNENLYQRLVAAAEAEVRVPHRRSWVSNRLRCVRDGRLCRRCSRRVRGRRKALSLGR